jgi:pimeloyl-ACP methyl ester carboxylesterase
MYVEYQSPQVKKFPDPIVMVHGAGHTGKTWDETPDGREGWKTYFLRKGFAVYVVDHAGRGRSGFDPTRNNRAKATSDTSGLTDFYKFTNESAWSLFRIGPEPFVPFPGTQFPVNSYHQYVAQILPNTETAINPACQTPGIDCYVTIHGIAALLDKIGPAIVMGWSQGGTISMRVAAVRPRLVKALIPVEPASGCVIADGDLPKFADIKMYAIFGDNLTPIWETWSSNCKANANRIVGVGGRAEVVMLARDLGITGNSHNLMMEKNNLQIADLIINWLKKEFRGDQR